MISLDNDEDAKEEERTEGTFRFDVWIYDWQRDQ